MLRNAALDSRTEIGASTGTRRRDASLDPPPAQRDRQVDVKVGHWSEVMGLKEAVLRRLAAEILVTELALG